MDEMSLIIINAPGLPGDSAESSISSVPGYLTVSSPDIATLKTSMALTCQYAVLRMFTVTGSWFGDLYNLGSTADPMAEEWTDTADTLGELMGKFLARTP